MSEMNIEILRGNRLPHPWAKIVFGFAVVACVTGAAGYMLVGHQNARPADLRERTTALADAFEQMLEGAGVSKDSIHREEPAVQEDSTGSWNAFQFMVDLPDAKKGIMFFNSLKRAMEANDVTTDGSAGMDGVWDIQMALKDRVFLTAKINVKPRADIRIACGRIADAVQAVLQTQGIAPDRIRRKPAEPREDDHAVWTFTRLEAPLPESKTAADFEPLIQAALTDPELHVNTAVDAAGTTVTVSHNDVACGELVLAKQDAAKPPAAEKAGASGAQEYKDVQLPATAATETAAPSGPPRVAILIDDGGDNKDAAEAILKLDHGLTLAFFPYGRYTAQIAERAKEAGFEVIVHMPMEALLKSGKPAAATRMPGVINTTMKPEEIHRMTDEAIAKVPGAVGMNNHMGSTFTANAAAVKVFMEGIKGKPLYYVDSVTTGSTKAYTIAKEMGIRTAKRDVFLDVEVTAGFFDKQFTQLIKVAKKKNTAIAIGHFRMDTARGLAQRLPELAQNGIKLVHGSELVQ